MMHLRILATVMLFFLVLQLSSAAADDSWSWQTLPEDGSIAGMPGTALGWGYSFRNNSTRYWLLIADLSLNQPIQHAKIHNILGVPIIAPGTELTIEYSIIAGLLGITWDSDAPVGWISQGDFEVGGYWYDADPSNPIAPGNFVTDAGIQTASYQAMVTNTLISAPEPSSVLLTVVGLMTSGLIIFCVSACRRRR